MDKEFKSTEIVIALVGAVGTDFDSVVSMLSARMKAAKYTTLSIKVSKDVIAKYFPPSSAGASAGEFGRISSMMDAGNSAREQCKDNGVLASGAMKVISTQRSVANEAPSPLGRHCSVINSIKHPKEVERLRQIYGSSFYLIGVFEDRNRRVANLTSNFKMSAEEADILISRDEREGVAHGQKVSDAFHLSDFFLKVDSNSDRIQNQVERVVDLIFGEPKLTPTFSEYAMFLAFSASLRSADLSRQVGAVIAKDNVILSTGANDCPRSGGGLYWPEQDPDTYKIRDQPNGRDQTKGFDSNRKSIDEIEKLLLGKIEGIVKTAIPTVDLDVLEGMSQSFAKELRDSPIRDLTEFGRVVHAEMDAILTCARTSTCSLNSTLYCTTFPCHNCAKHIVAAGIQRVVYIEPYPKSKALAFHKDSIEVGFFEENGGSKKVIFEPFVGVGPRRFFDLFSMTFGSGSKLIRKDSEGNCVKWELATANARLQLNPGSYLELEHVAVQLLTDILLESTSDAADSPPSTASGSL